MNCLLQNFDNKWRKRPKNTAIEKEKIFWQILIFYINFVPFRTSSFPRLLWLQCDLMARLFVQYLAIYKKWQFDQQDKRLASVGSKLSQILNGQRLLNFFKNAIFTQFTSHWSREPNFVCTTLFTSPVDTCRRLVITLFFFLKKGPFPATFFFIFVFSIHSWQ